MRDVLPHRLDVTLVQPTVEGVLESFERGRLLLLEMHGILN